MEMAFCLSVHLLVVSSEMTYKVGQMYVCVLSTFSVYKASIPLGQRQWNLARIFYGSGDNFKQAEFWILVPASHGATQKLPGCLTSLVSKDIKETGKCRFGRRLVQSGIMNFDPCVVRSPNFVLGAMTHPGGCLFSCLFICVSDAMYYCQRRMLIMSAIYAALTFCYSSCHMWCMSKNKHCPWRCYAKILTAFVTYLWTIHWFALSFLSK